MWCERQEANRQTGESLAIYLIYLIKIDKLHLASNFVVGEARGNRGPAAPGAGAGAPRCETVTNGGGAARGRAVARGGTAVRAAAQPQGPRYTARRGALRGVARGAMGRGRGGGQVVGNNILLTGGNTEALGGNANYENDLVDEQL